MSFYSSRSTSSLYNYRGETDLIPSSSNTLKSSSSTGSLRSSPMYTKDWRTALRTPPTYRIGNRTLRFNYHFGILCFGICALFLLFFYVRSGSSSSSDAAWLKQYASSSIRSNSIMPTNEVPGRLSTYNGPINTSYPLTPAILGRGGSVTYRIGLVADLDTNSKVTKSDGSIVWRSYIKKGYLTYTNTKKDIKLKWDIDGPIKLESSFSLKGRGMELSELVTFNGKLLTFDDRTGLVYEIINDKPIPWVILLDGNGRNSKGFKSEWATVKRNDLIVGSMGKEWTTSSGEFENENPMYIKSITKTGEVRSIDWSYNYKKLREETMQIKWPGYMIHESGVWSELQQKWYFLPRRCSKEVYNETRDEHMGCNVLISADERFTKFERVNLDPLNSATTHGFSSFKFMPFTEDRIIVAIKSEELNGKTSTYITAFDLEGNTLLPEQLIDGEIKYEGFEFI